MNDYEFWSGFGKEIHSSKTLRNPKLREALVWLHPEEIAASVVRSNQLLSESFPPRVKTRLLRENTTTFAYLNSTLPLALETELSTII
ncbi:MAG: hypothetical protein EOP04_03465 [Proteobacteria bacterium]|nr:MAG: hypothetical protein EOP04_03465 [Pseudomonadota bacterium]